MTNKCLLSLLVVISITTLCKVNASVTSCFVGRWDDAKSQTCPDDANYGCFQLDWIPHELGCADQAYCDELKEDPRYGSCCMDKDNCNEIH